MGSSRRVKQKRRRRKLSKFVKWFVGVVLPLIIVAFIEAQTDLFTNIISEATKKVEYEEAAVVPLFYVAHNDSLELSSIRSYAEIYGNEVLGNGCVLSAYIYNHKSKPVAVSENALIIDKIQKIEEPRVYIIGEYKSDRNKFCLYVINNGQGILDYGEVSLFGFFYNSVTSESGELNQEKLKELFNEYTPIKIENLQSGEIRKIAEYEVNQKAVRSSSYALSYTVVDIAGNNIQKQHSNIGQFNYEDNRVRFYFSQGDSTEFTAKRHVQVKTDEDEGKKLYLPANYMIEGNSWKNILFSLYPDTSCVLEFHAEIKCVGQKEVIETERFSQEIYVPLYKEEDYFFFTLRSFLSGYEKNVYYYNSDMMAQEMFEYEIV